MKVRISAERLQQLCITGLMVLLLIISGLNARNVPLWLGNLLTEASVVGIIAIGMTFVMIAGGFDLSVGSIAAVCGCVAVLVMKAMPDAPTGLAIGVAVMATLVAGGILGAINGVLIAYVKVNPFVVTLSSMFVFRGIGLVITHQGQSQVVPAKFKEAYRTIYWQALHLPGIRISVPVFIFAGLFLVGFYLLRFTRFGHYVYATGGNAKAAWLSGVNTRAITAWTYIISGIVCAVAALIWTGLSTTAQASDYSGREMIVIASVIVGGTPLNGGRGGLFATLSGLLLLFALDQLLTQQSVGPEYRQIVTGLIILVAVVLDTLFKRDAR